MITKGISLNSSIGLDLLYISGKITPMKKDSVSYVMTDYCCPLCNSQLARFEGAPRNPNFGGVTLACPSLKCPAQEVFGHGRSEKSAYSTILSKYANDRQARTEVEEDEPTPQAPAAEDVL